MGDDRASRGHEGCPPCRTEGGKGKCLREQYWRAGRGPVLFNISLKFYIEEANRSLGAARGLHGTRGMQLPASQTGRQLHMDAEGALEGMAGGLQHLRVGSTFFHITLSASRSWSWQG